MPVGVYMRTPEMLASRREKLKVYRKSPEERFWKLVERADDCLVWMGDTNQDGYGRFRIDSVRGNNHRIVAHRYAWMLAGRALAKRKVLHHHCKNRACVNVEHLSVIPRGVHTSLHMEELYGRR